MSTSTKADTRSIHHVSRDRGGHPKRTNSAIEKTHNLSGQDIIGVIGTQITGFQAEIKTLNKIISLLVIFLLRVL